MSEDFTASEPTESIDAGEAEPIEVTDLTPEEYSKYKVKYKVSGQERYATIDEIIKQASLGEGARSKFDQAVTERKKAEAMMRDAEARQSQYNEIVELLQSAHKDPRVFKEIVKELGADHLNDFITEYIIDRAKEEGMSKEEKQIREYEQKLAAYEARQREIQEREDHEKLQSRSSLVYNSISNEFADAIQSVEKTDLAALGNLPDSSPKKQSVYLAMERALVLAEKQLMTSGSFEPLDVLYKKGLSQIRSLTAAGREEALANLSDGKTPIPRELARAFSKQQVEELRKSHQGRSIGHPKGTPERSSKTSKKPMTISDFFD